MNTRNWIARATAAALLVALVASGCRKAAPEAQPTTVGHKFGALGGAVAAVHAGTNVTITGTHADPIINASGGGGGGVTSVSGAAPISVSGTTTPLIALPVLKAAVRVVATSNLTLSGEQTIDGVLTSGSRVLATAQTSAAQDGIYVTAAGAWSRASDLASDSDVATGAVVPVTAGTVYAGSEWMCTNAAPSLASGLTFAQVGPPSFGSDTVVKLPNVASTLVNGLEMVNTLTTSTAGSEASKYVVKLLLAGSQVDALDIRNDRAFVRTGGLWLSNTGASTEGMIAVGSALELFSNGAQRIQIDSAGNILFINGGSLLLDSTYVRGIKLLGVSTQIYGDGNYLFGTATSNLAVSTTVGMVQESVISGAPTSTPSAILLGGHMATIGDSTNNKTWHTLSSRWYANEREGKGTDVASGGTVTIAAAERAEKDYFKLTGTTACDFMTTTATDVYATIRDGAQVTFRLAGNITFDNNTASPPANTKPFLLQGGVNAVLLSGAIVSFRLDADAGGWVEMFRRAP